MQTKANQVLARLILRAACALLVLGGHWLQAQTMGSEVPLTIKRAVILSFQTMTNEHYQIYSSSDLETWTKFGDPVMGDGKVLTTTYLTDGSGHAYFTARTGTGGTVEVIKTLADFKDYKSWRLVRTVFGPDPLLSGGAHGGESFHRSIYVQPTNAVPVSGRYPSGTVFLKELRLNDNGQPGELAGAFTIMVKRGGAFNPEGNGWEYFMSDLQFNQTLAQGGSETMCFGCHSAAKDQDFVFSKLP